jgi:hypothetical protein
MHTHGSLPRARKDGLFEETVGEELLLYDRDSHTAHCLSPVAACVWRHCDGEHDLTELANLTEASENLIANALHELREKDLLVAEPALTQSAVPGISRREAIGRVARYGAAAAAGSLIVSATAATPALAASSATCCQCQDLNNNNKICTTTAVSCSSSKGDNEACEKWCKEAPRNWPNGFCTGTSCNGTACS